MGILMQMAERGPGSLQGCVVSPYEYKPAGCWILCILLRRVVRERAVVICRVAVDVDADIDIDTCIRTCRVQR